MGDAKIIFILSGCATSKKYVEGTFLMNCRTIQYIGAGLSISQNPFRRK